MCKHEDASHKKTRVHSQKTQKVEFIHDGSAIGIHPQRIQEQGLIYREYSDLSSFTDSI